MSLQISDNSKGHQNLFFFSGRSDSLVVYSSKRYGPSNSMNSKKISNDQELTQSDPISCPQNQK